MSDLRRKTLNRAELLSRYGRPSDQQVVFTNGCFDILHRGHVEYLTHARTLGDVLVVGLNSDASVRRLKGPGRPVNCSEDRAVVLAGLAAVDAIVVFHEDTPQSLIAELMPDVLTKGGDYLDRELVGAKEVVAAGGKVVISRLIAGRSTTAIIQRR